MSPHIKYILKHCHVCLLLVSSKNGLPQSPVNTTPLEKLIQYCDSTKADEILLTKDNNVVCNWKRMEFKSVQMEEASMACGSPYLYTASMVKSWTGLLIGVLMDKKMIHSVNDLACTYLPEWTIGCKDSITIKHLLTMTAGFDRLGANGILSKGNANQFALNLKTKFKPGTRFNYSNESVQLLGMIIEHVTNLPAEKAFDKYLFAPLDMDSTSFAKDSVGNTIVYGGCTTTVYNAHKIAQLMLNKGKYKSTQVISSAWIEESISVKNVVNYYGYLWWIDRNSKYFNYAAMGDLGQITILFPEWNAVFIRKQSCDLSPQSIHMSWMGPAFIQLIAETIN